MNQPIPVDATVTATLTVEAEGTPAALIIVDRDSRDATVVMPGSEGEVSITPRRPGLLHVLVTTDDETAGSLSVSPGGAEGRPTRGDHEEAFLVAKMQA